MSKLAGQPSAADGRREASVLEHGSDPVLEQRWPRRAAGGGRWWRDARRRRMLAAADLIAVAVAASIPIVATGSPWPIVFLPLWILIAKFFGLYDRDHRALRHLTADEVPALLAWAATVTGLLALLLPLTPAGSLGGAGAVAHAALLALAVIIARSLARRLWWLYTPPEHVGLIGDSEGLESMRRKFGLFRDMHFELAGEHGVGRLGGPSERNERLLAIAEGVDRIVVCCDDVDTALIADLSALCRSRQVKLSVVSPLRGRALPSRQIAQLADLPILEYNTWDAPRSSLMIKRGLDLTIAVVGLVALAPALPLLALAIRLDSRGPLLFSQVRVGLGGRPFRMYKFRTMHSDAEQRLDDLVKVEQLDDPMFKLRDDPRVTRVGRLLRRLSVDELPQLFNVLVGEMSVVGPRPEQVEIVARYKAEDRFRFKVKPGITGPMQVFGRGELTFSERLAVELEYVENPSAARDLRIILHTIPAMFRGTGAF